MAAAPATPRRVARERQKLVERRSIGKPLQLPWAEP
jgi:hypothetical protein